MRTALKLFSFTSTVALALGAFALTATESASAHGSYASTWSGRYPASSTLTNVSTGTGQSCALCHFTVGGGSNWNAYGWKMRQGTQAGQTALNAIISAESFNSDVDPTGSTNVFEINANAQPGWTPGAANTEYFTSSTTPGLAPPAGILGNLNPAVPTSFCKGDGTGAACPCGNTGAAGNGCANATFAAGALLTATGTAGASAGTDTLVLTATNVPGPALFIQSNGVLGTPANFGDGHLCAAVGIIRLGVVFPTGSTASYPGGLTPNPIHIQGSTANGNTRHYQAWYRSLPALCGAGNYDLTQGLTIVWGP